MKTGKKVIVLLLAGVMSVSLLSGCGEKKVVKNVSSSQSYLKDLEDGNYYVYHVDDTGTPTVKQVCFGKANFDQGSTANGFDAKRVMWYKEDYDNIPTLYAGDSLIYYTNSELDEKFKFERFFDYGYTIGLCNLEETDSGRYKISTKVDDSCTYPNGDTDSILRFSNGSVIVDSVAGRSLRAPEKDSTVDTDKDNKYASIYEALQRKDATISVTPSGTINGLAKNGNYDVEVYEGTNLPQKFTFAADIRAFGSYQTTTSTNYSFDGDKNVITIGIPSYFNSGYYNINGMGMFRYVAAGNSYDDSTDFNVINQDPDDAKDSVSYDSSSDTLNDSKLSNDKSTATFNVSETGQLALQITFTLKDGYVDGDGLPDVTAVVTYPSGGKSKEFSQNDEGLYLSFNADEVGTYTITYYDLNARIPEVSVVEN